MKLVHHALTTLEGLSGSIQKQSYLSRAADLATLKEVMQYTLDPFRTYGVKQTSKVARTSSTGVTWETWKDLLDDLASRKLSGLAARAAIDNLLEASNAETQSVIGRVLARDLKCGLHTTSINKVFPGLIPTFEVSLAKSMEDRKLKFPMQLETKHDGKRIIAIAREGEPVRFYSRNGHEDAGYQHIKEQLSALAADRELVFDGELMFGMFGDRKAKEHEADYVVFDLLTWDEWLAQKCTRKQSDRTHAIYDLGGIDRLGPNILGPNASVVNSLEEAMVYYREVLNNGSEGVMLKDPNAGYQFKRGWHWQKIKPELSEDLTVVGVFEGEGKYARMLGGVVVDFNGKEVRVGSGFADYQRKMWWVNSAGGPVAPEEVVFSELVGKTVEVLYTEVTPDGSLRFPRFKCVRDDK